MMRNGLEERAWSALDGVLDPCSVATRSPLNIVDMGLVRRLSADEAGNVRVEISPTAPSCILIASIAEAAEKAIRAVDGVAKVTVSLDSDFFWTPDAMTERGAALLAQYRASRADRMPQPRGLVKRGLRGNQAVPAVANNGT
jgi:metal-sulfur cluster biosynthetic enzyme